MAQNANPDTVNLRISAWSAYFKFGIRGGGGGDASDKALIRGEVPSVFQIRDGSRVENPTKLAS